MNSRFPPTNSSALSCLIGICKALVAVHGDRLGGDLNCLPSRAA
jgi:hypothetical protein